MQSGPVVTAAPARRPSSANIWARAPVARACTDREAVAILVAAVASRPQDPAYAAQGVRGLLYLGTEQVQEAVA